MRFSQRRSAPSLSLELRQDMIKTQHFLLFDLDGTISDPIVGIVSSVNHALTHFGHAPREAPDLRVHIGPPLDEAFRALLGLSSLADIAPYVAKYRERYASIGYSENVLYPGMRETLFELDSAGVQMGVCTSKRADFAVRILEMFGIREVFQFVDGGEIGIHKWQQIERLKAKGLVDKMAIMIGDRAVDIDAGHRNGIHAAGVLWGYGTHEEIKSAAPEYVVTSPGDLKGLLQG